VLMCLLTTIVARRLIAAVRFDGVNCVYYDLSFNIIPVNSVDLI
jgi:hypothetical protein